MQYFGENNEYIFAECEVCRSEMYIERETASDEDAYAYKCIVPLRCKCGEISDTIKKSGKSCHQIRQELSVLSDLLHRQREAGDRIASINAELGRKVKSPPFHRIVAKDFMFALKCLLVTGGVVLGAEILLFVVSCVMFFIGLAFTMPDLSLSGNALFYNLNIFKDRGGEILGRFGFDPVLPAFSDELAKKELITGYIPYAIAGIFLMVFYVFLAVLLIRLLISFIRFIFYMSRIVGKNVMITAKKEEYVRQLEILGRQYQDYSVQISEQTILAPDYKNIRATDTIYTYFLNNRTDNLRDAINIFHDEDLRIRSLDFQKAIYTELRQTKRYVKALYVIASDENAKVDVREESAELGEERITDMIGAAYKKLRRKMRPPEPKEPESALSGNAKSGIEAARNDNEEQNRDTPEGIAQLQDAAEDIFGGRDAETVREEKKEEEQKETPAETNGGT